MSWRRPVAQLLAGALGLWLATRFVPDVSFTASPGLLILCGILLGLSNLFVKPILKKIALPLRIITLGLFGLIINMGLIWVLDILFPELIIKGLLPLFWTTLIIWGLEIGLSALLRRTKKSTLQNPAELKQ